MRIEYCAKLLLVKGTMTTILNRHLSEGTAV
jgi:hypothetical protein